MQRMIKVFALGTALCMVGCASYGGGTWNNDYYTANGKAADNFAYEKDKYQCDKENEYSTIKTKNDGSIRGTYYYVDKRASDRCMSVRGWYQAKTG